MTPARLVILGVALAAGGGAAYLASTTSEPAPAPLVAAPPPPSIKTTEVLVASGDLPLGTIVGPRDTTWQTWPADGATSSMITRTAQPNAQQDFAGSVARFAISAGEPVRREKLVKTDNAGVMSAILPAGSRALAITIDTRGANTAGGFILPNDRVDLIRIYRDEAASKFTGNDVVMSETLLRNIRVLAIGQNIQERNGEKVVVGETATLELDPRQVEVVTLAQRQGQLSLSLRSIQDIGSNTTEQTAKTEDVGLTIVRYGAASQR